MTDVRFGLSHPHFDDDEQQRWAERVNDALKTIEQILSVKGTSQGDQARLLQLEKEVKRLNLRNARNA